MKTVLSIITVIILAIVIAVAPTTTLGQDKDPTVKCQLHAT